MQVKESDNYFVIITREDLPNLPYSVKEIYGIRISNKCRGLKQVYNEFYHLYGKTANTKLDKEDILLAEDSNSGFEFFSSTYGGQVQCVSAQGKSNIFGFLQTHRQ